MIFVMVHDRVSRLMVDVALHLRQVERRRNALLRVTLRIKSINYAKAGR